VRVCVCMESMGSTAWAILHVCALVIAHTEEGAHVCMWVDGGVFACVYVCVCLIARNVNKREEESMGSLGRESLHLCKTLGVLMRVVR
jgi:hypothetical protein